MFPRTGVRGWSQDNPYPLGPLPQNKLALIRTNTKVYMWGIVLVGSCPDTSLVIARYQVIQEYPPPPQDKNIQCMDLITPTMNYTGWPPQSWQLCSDQLILGPLPQNKGIFSGPLHVQWGIDLGGEFPVKTWLYALSSNYRSARLSWISGCTL